jgi:molybdopterin converting factor small subunit
MTVIYIRYFGKLRELLGVKKEEYNVEEETTLADLLVSHVPERHSTVSKTWAETLFRTVRGEMAQNRNGTPVLGDYLVTLNGKSVILGERLKEGDEVAIMPPFGGG